MTNFFNKFKASLSGAFVYSILAGTIGSLIIILFFSGIFSANFLGRLFPWIIGFNAAITGYALLDNTRNRLKHKILAAVGCGVLMTLLVYLVITTAMRFSVPVTFSHFLTSVIVGLLFSGFGAWLAKKYHHLE